MYGGEDYVLLFTLPSEAQPPRWATQIGVFNSKRVVVDGQLISQVGFDHFRAGEKVHMMYIAFSLSSSCQLFLWLRDVPIQHRRRTHRLNQSKQRMDRVLARMLSSPRKLLITILLGNEVTNVALSVVGASIAQETLSHLSAPEQALVSAVFVVPTLLIVGEITPKTLAAHKSEPVARTLIGPLSLFAFTVQPLVLLLKVFSGSLVRFFSREVTETTTDGQVEIAESEFRTLIDAGMREGIVEAQERRMIHNVLDFGEMTVRDVMQPWDNVITLKETCSIEEAIETVIQHQFSRLPLWRKDQSTVTGIVLAKDLLIVKWKRRTAKNLQHLRRTPLFTPPIVQRRIS